MHTAHTVTVKHGEMNTSFISMCACSCGTSCVRLCACSNRNWFCVARPAYAQAWNVDLDACMCVCVCNAFTTASFLPPLGVCKCGWSEGNLTA